MSERAVTRLLRVFLCVIAVWLVVLGLFNLHHPSDWAMGDWLINYSDGFVRRGLIGSAVLALAKWGAPPLWTVLILQWLLYAIVLITVWRMAGRVRWRWWTAAMVFSPATLAFVLLDPPFAFRKEILLFALLALLLQLLPPADVISATPRAEALAILVMTAGCVICVLAHEGLAVFFPYLFAVMLLSGLPLRRGLVLLTLPAAVSVASFALVSHHPGDVQTAAAICRSIGGVITDPPSGICGGAIDYLSHDAAYAHVQVAAMVRHGSFGLLIPLLFLLPLLPVTWGIWSQPKVRRAIFLSCAGAASLASISLFYYGTDWTRWIYIHVFCLMLLLLACEAQPQAGREKPYVGEQTAFGSVGLAGLLVYALGWHVTIYAQRPLYGSFIRFLTHNLIPGKQ